MPWPESESAVDGRDGQPRHNCFPQFLGLDNGDPLIHPSRVVKSTRASRLKEGVGL